METGLIFWVLVERDSGVRIKITDVMDVTFQLWHAIQKINVISNFRKQQYYLLFVVMFVA